ncbi:MAG TPA: hypothetical protein VFY25_01650 [Anaerolineales bacterium]|nr:hypothetical protein [Anaerolineales bacterium]
MKLHTTETLSARPEVLRAKHAYGAWFGIALGLTFSIFAWGIDAYRLEQINGLYPWIKFVGGALPCVLVGGLTGWLAARLDKPILALLLWALAAFFFAWLTVSLPLQIVPRVLSLLEPDIKGLLHYTYYEEFSARVGVAYVWLVIFMALSGLLQIPLSDSAIFATSFLGKISPMLIVLVLMAISGSVIDSLNNELLRGPVNSLNNPVQFLLDNRGKEIDPAVSRRMHLGALRAVRDLITPERKYIVSGYDAFLEQVQVLARFEGAWVECDLIVNQLIYCEQVGNPQ